MSGAPGGSRRYCAGIVLFHPEGNVYLESIESLVDAGITTIVFDNSEAMSATSHVSVAVRERFARRDVLYVHSGTNIGLSAAYNRIVQVAERLGQVEALLLFDQDSTVRRESVCHLLATYERARRVCDVGVLSGSAMSDGGPYRVYRLGTAPDALRELLAVKMAPSSFSLIPFSAFGTVGRFHDDFFIDHIDVDFCHRCRRAGLLVAIDLEAPFLHRIGHGLVTVFGYPLTPVSSPFRHYYQVRNILLSARRRGAGWTDATKEVLKRLVVIGIVGVSAGRFWQRYRFAFRGLFDGLRNRGGRLHANG